MHLCGLNRVAATFRDQSRGRFLSFVTFSPFFNSTNAMGILFEKVHQNCPKNWPTSKKWRYSWLQKPSKLHWWCLFWQSFPWRKEAKSSKLKRSRLTHRGRRSLSFAPRARRTHLTRKAACSVTNETRLENESVKLSSRCMKNETSFAAKKAVRNNGQQWSIFVIFVQKLFKLEQNWLLNQNSKEHWIIFALTKRPRNS